MKAGRWRHVIVSSRGRSEACRQRVHSVARATLSLRISRGAMCRSAGWGLVQYPHLILGSVHPKPPPLGSGASRAGGLNSFCTDAEPRGARKVLQRGTAASGLGAVLQVCQATRGGIYYRDPTGSAAPADRSSSLAAWRKTTPLSLQRSSLTGSRVRDGHAFSPRIHKSHAPFSWKLGMLRRTVALISPPTSRAIGAARRLRPRPHSSPLAGKAGTRS